jgi:hypothetical protein
MRRAEVGWLLVAGVFTALCFALIPSDNAELLMVALLAGLGVCCIGLIVQRLRGRRGSQSDPAGRG